VAGSVSLVAPAAAQLGEQLPGEVAKLLAAEPFPETAPDPKGRYLLLVHKRGLQSLRALAEPMLDVGGVRVNTRTNARHAALPYFGLTLVDVWTGLSRRIPLPPNVSIGFPLWSPDGAHFVFTVTVDDGVELWLGSRDHPRPVRKLVGAELNAAHGTPCDWMPDSSRVLCQTVVREDRESVAAAIRQLSQSAVLPQMAASNELLAEYFLRSRLELIEVGSGTQRTLGEPAVFESVEPAPSGEYVLVTRTLSPYANSFGTLTARRVNEVWNVSGEVVDTITATDGKSPRALQWHSSKPATLAWVESRGGAEHVVAQAAPFTGLARTLFSSPRRFAGLQWLDDSALALVNEYDPLDRLTRVWLIDSGELPAAPRLLGSRAVDAAHPELGWPLTRRNAAGKTVVATHQGQIYLKGREPTTEGGRSYLTRLSLDSFLNERVWQSATSGREHVVDVLAADGSLLLTQRESAREPPNYRVRNLRDDSVRAVTHYQHPVPELLATKRIPLRYRRDDGLEMSSMLYVPPGAAPDEPLPLIVWAYPREYGAGSMPALGTTDRFVDVERGLKLFFLLCGYAVMDDVSMPVIGTTNDANDTFVQQIVANARAAIDAAAETGIVDRTRAAVAGHSYGAFMVANLLAHSRIFKAGVGLSGAYNRTLTPFGFQTERRTLWEARDTYLAMSPFFYSDRIEAPLLLVHGLLDDNAGTLPIQSQYLYEAIRRNGGDAELLLLPLEGHSYRGRESVMSTASAMLRLLDKHLRRESTNESPLSAADRTSRSVIERP
jgi:dipeptidyl aminopeptidase/acylaminoacyl peptidase